MATIEASKVNLDGARRSGIFQNIQLLIGNIAIKLLFIH